MRFILVFAMVVALAAGDASAQTGATDENAWSFSAAVARYILADEPDYFQPTLSADYKRLHLEARANYEDLDTGSVWIGCNFSGGTTVEWELTPMIGGVFGNTTAVAPGLALSVGWWKVELYADNEYVVDTGERSDSFFYNWSELTLAPVEWFRFGMVTQRTRAYQSDREIQRGVMAGVSLGRLNLTGYVFNPDDDRPFYVFAVDADF
jgi:hypothetical protein